MVNELKYDPMNAMKMPASTNFNNQTLRRGGSHAWNVEKPAWKFVCVRPSSVRLLRDINYKV